MNIAELTAERDRLVARIAEIDALIASAAEATTRFSLVEVTESGRTKWRIARDGVAFGSTFGDRQIAEDMLATRNAISEDWTISYEQRGRMGWSWLARKDGRSRPIDMPTAARLVAAVAEDEAAAPARMIRAAERAVEAEAERIAAEEAARVAAERAKLATPRQVEFILTLLAQQEFQLGGGGFVVGGPTKREDIAKLTKEQASAYITSLKGDY